MLFQRGEFVVIKVDVNPSACEESKYIDISLSKKISPYGRNDMKKTLRHSLAHEIPVSSEEREWHF